MKTKDLKPGMEVCHNDRPSWTAGGTRAVVVQAPVTQVPYWSRYSGKTDVRFKPAKSGQVLVAVERVTRTYSDVVNEDGTRDLVSEERVWQPRIVWAMHITSTWADHVESKAQASEQAKIDARRREESRKAQDKARAELDAALKTIGLETEKWTDGIKIKLTNQQAAMLAEFINNAQEA